MALEKDQERPISPSGSRKIKFRNMKYILDMPMVNVAGGLQSNQNSASKKDDANALFYGTGTFNGTQNSTKVLH